MLPVVGVAAGMLDLVDTASGGTTWPPRRRT
jgi:hypothetical protein